jgi:catechol 2,3-dioxygenase-like lactoylglutathione lyase family enzyme
MGVFDGVSAGSVIVRVADVDRAVDWYRDKFDIEPLYVGADGEHRIAGYQLGGLIVSLWQLPADQAERPDPAVSTYPVFVTDDIDAAHDAVLFKGLTTTGIRESETTRFFQVDDLDGNRWEFAAGLVTSTPTRTE